MNPATPADLDAIDWARPWLAPWRARGEPLARRAMQIGLISALNEAAEAAPELRLRAGPLRFVAQATLPAGEGYEAFIDRCACVPTRANLHDFFNGLAWLRHPALKRRMNELQAAAVRARGAAPTRGRLRDLLTILDENGALLSAPPAFIERLRRRDWHGLFVGERADWAGVRFELFGHALLEKLVHPRKAITAHVWVAPSEPAAAPRAGDEIAEAFSAPESMRTPLLPMPVLGVPGWWAANEAPVFYADAAVFRAAPNKTATRGSLF